MGELETHPPEPTATGRNPKSEICEGGKNRCISRLSVAGLPLVRSAGFQSCCSAGCPTRVALARPGAWAPPDGSPIGKSAIQQVGKPALPRRLANGPVAGHRQPRGAPVCLPAARNGVYCKTLAKIARTRGFLSCCKDANLAFVNLDGNANSASQPRGLGSAAQGDATRPVACSRRGGGWSSPVIRPAHFTAISEASTGSSQRNAEVEVVEG
jgi:hypothetical protein